MMAATFEKDEQLNGYITFRSRYLLPLMTATAAITFAGVAWLIWDDHTLYPIKSHIGYLLKVLHGQHPLAAYIQILTSHHMIAPITWRLSVAGIFGVIAAIVVGWHWFPRPDRLKGLFVFDGVQVFDKAKQALAALKQTTPRGAKKGIQIYHGDGGTFRLPFELETKHILYLGSVGTGKTASMLHAVQALIDRGDSAVIYDYKGDFTEWLGGMDNTHMIAFAHLRHACDLKY